MKLTQLSTQRSAMTTTLEEVLDLFKQVAQAQKDTDRRLREQSLESDIQPGETTTAINGSQFQPKNW